MSNGVAFFFKLGFFPCLIYPSLKWVEQMQLEVYTLESPNLKRSSHSHFLYFEKTHIFTRRIAFGPFHDSIVSHTCIRINKQLNLNVLQYTILCLESILSVYPIINTNIQISTLNHPLQNTITLYTSVQC